MIRIDSYKIAPGQATFIIAEAGVNHNGDMEMAKRLIDVAADSGAHAVKFQTFKAKNLVTQTARKASYQMQNTTASESQFDMLQRLELLPGMHQTLQAHAREKGILFLSTPFDEESADLLDALGIPAFKVSSGELTNLPFLRHLAGKKKPIILSTGMATLGEVEAALDVIQQSGQSDIIVLHCVSTYPTPPQEVNLNAMLTLQKAFGLATGYSDHTLGIAIPFAAVAKGALVIEKHFTLDRSLPGPDHSASLEPDELRAMVAGIRQIEAALGDGRKVPAPSERDTRQVARKSLVAARDIQPGAVLGADDIVMKRPGTGIPPAHLVYVIGRRAQRLIPADSLITLDALE